MTYNPIICAIDTSDVKSALDWSAKLKAHIGVLKVGLEFFTACGPEGVKQIVKQGMPVFLDLKSHDIPNTVAGMVRNAASLGVDMFTVHTTGGMAMLKAAAKAASDGATAAGKKRPLILGVTMLTSLDESDMKAIGISRGMKEQVGALAKLAQDSGLDGVVCSSHEISTIRMACGPDLKIIVPGIRPAGFAAGDQKRTMTPKEAMEEGADYIVVGRPITEANDPVKAAADIAASMH